jgi:hypothetical protein
VVQLCRGRRRGGSDAGIGVDILLEIAAQAVGVTGERRAMLLERSGHGALDGDYAGVLRQVARPGAAGAASASGAPCAPTL